MSFRTGISKDIIFSSTVEELRGSPSPAVVRTGGNLVGRGIANPQEFVSYLKSQNKRNIRQLLCYASRYHTILETGDASILATVSGAVRRHIMEALTAYAKFAGTYERFQEIRKRYQLRWTNGDESLQVLQRFFDTNLTLESMLFRIREMIRGIPRHMGEVVRFAVLTGLRPAESCESVRLLNSSVPNYYSPERQILEHFRFPEIFLRTTKKAYVSYLSRDNYHYFANLGPKSPTWNSIRHACRRRNINMDMRLCRKIFASWLIQSGIDTNTVDLLSGRVPQSVLVRHYQVPQQDLKERVLTAVDKLQEEL